ncbi:MAG TPA: [protein-PII] uridylyltransferase [Rhodanobacteraceae bacterium]|nr:[protein-PII] uridylyltransferase [Rhodanobacteraceae bacterium]
MSQPNADSSVLAPPRALPEAVPLAGVSAEARQALRQWLGDVDRALAAALDAGAPAASLVRQRSARVDALLTHVRRAILGELEDAALFAVGGYGRGLLFPHSDIDLLLLVRQPPTEERARALEAFVGCLWDIGLRPGQAVRTINDCRALAAADVGVFTTLLDARRLAGDPALADALRALVDAPAMWPPADYLAAKREEQAARHARFDDTAHNLEPNLKESPGGLRTLDLLRWLGRRVAHADGFGGLVAEGLLDAAERESLGEAEATLQRYRYALHLEAGRPEERLLFDYQRALAARLGFRDQNPDPVAGGGKEPLLGVEQFMQGYYRAATVVERLGVQLVERFDELLEADAPAQSLGADFVRRGRRLDTRDEDLFMRRPAALVEGFVLRIDHPELIGFSAETMRRIQHALASHGPALADDADVLAAFLALLQRGAPAAEALWRMNRHGVLAAILPPFARVVGRMQYDLFHVYTVDEHTVRVLRNVARFADPDARREFPLGCEVWSGIDKPELVLLAALFHDIAKGRGGDHSALGEGDARAFCARLGLVAADAELVAWLVRNHLLMSTTAQRQDITDPDVVQAFARKVGDWERLDHLYLLTVADIRGTSPRLWNAWKDRLLADLYVAARYALRGDPALPLRADTRVRECRERALKLLLAEGFDADRVAAVWADFPDASFLRHRPEQIAWQTRAIARHGALPLVAVHPLSVRGTTELFVCAEDRRGLFAAITAALDKLRFSVVEARILSSRTGFALDTFLLLESDSQQPAAPARAEELARALRAALARVPYRSQPVRRGLPRQLRHFQMQPRAEFADDVEAGRTQLALVCTDRPGLLAAVAQAFRDSGVRVYDARIATFGERVEDFFLLTDDGGQPLSPAQREQLHQALIRRLGPPSGDPPRGH